MCVKETGGMFARVYVTFRLRFKFVCDDWKKDKQRGMLRKEGS